MVLTSPPPLEEKPPPVGFVGLIRLVNEHNHVESDKGLFVGVGEKRRGTYSPTLSGPSYPGITQLSIHEAAHGEALRARTLVG